MTRRNVLLWLGIAVAAIVVDLALLYAPWVGEDGASRLVFLPIVLAGLVGTYWLGVRKAKKASMRSRVLSAGLWCAPWLLLLCLPWALLAGGYAWELLFPVRPPDVLSNVPLFIAYNKPGGFANGYNAGIEYASSTNRPWLEIERHYTERLARRGWRYQWTGEIRDLSSGIPAPPAGAPLPRWILYRRFDGVMLVQIGTLEDGTTCVVTDYELLGWERWRDVPNFLRIVSPTDE